MLTLEQERHMVLLGTHGTTCYPPEQRERWAYAEANWAPEWLTAAELGTDDPSDCVTVLDYSLRAPDAPAGWRLAYQFAAGEHECPWCGEGTGHETARADCKLCEGEGLIYQGEECQVCVFAPAPVVAEPVASEPRSMTWGVMPSREAFREAFERECPGGRFTFRNDRYMGSGSFSEEELWGSVVTALDRWDWTDATEGAGNWASSVITFLGFEWI